MSDKEKTTVKPKRKMRPGGGKAKGNGFESTIAKKLSTSLPVNFIRSPGSGARVGGKNMATIGMMMGDDALKLFNADVVPVNEKAAGYKFHYSIECKSYATADNFTSLVSGTANIFKWFEESVVDAAKIGKEPILIFKWNRTPIFVAVLARTMEGVATPALKLNRPQGFKDIDIYEFDELIKYQEFWVSPL